MRCDWTNCKIKEACFEINKRIAKELNTETVEYPLFCIANIISTQIIKDINRIITSIKRGD